MPYAAVAQQIQPADRDLTNNNTRDEQGAVRCSDFVQSGDAGGVNFFIGDKTMLEDPNGEFSILGAITINS